MVRICIVTAPSPLGEGAVTNSYGTLSNKRFELIGYDPKQKNMLLVKYVDDPVVSTKKARILTTILKVILAFSVLIPAIALIAYLRNCQNFRQYDFVVNPEIDKKEEGGSSLPKIDVLKSYNRLAKKTDLNESIRTKTLLDKSKVDGRNPHIPCNQDTAVVTQAPIAMPNQKEFLHANYVKMADGRTYIATQAPFVGDKFPRVQGREKRPRPMKYNDLLFWKMCFDNSHMIVDLTRGHIEGNYHCYYPN